MSFKVTINNNNDIKRDITFPALRLWVGPKDDEDKPLVVLFTSRTSGVALTTSSMRRVGVPEDWVEVTNAYWVKCSITLTSED